MAMAQFKVTSNAPQWLAALREKQKPVADAAVKALNETATNAVAEGRQDIAAAGRFGPKWQQGLKFVTRGEGLQTRAIIFHSIGLAGGFEHGVTIAGKPLLWIPTTPGAPSPRKSRKRLVSVNIAGKPPMLFDKFDRDRNRKPLYIGVPQVHIPKKFHITEIVADHVKRIAQLFIKYFKG
jgi:hypothetical protein